MAGEGEEMTTRENRGPKTIGISISDSPDMKALGLGNGHLRDAMTEVATYLMSSGDDLAYGGDLRENGFTWTLFELASRYTKQPSAFVSHSHDGREFVEQLRRVVNYFAWPVHIRMTNDELDLLAGEVGNVADLKFLDIEGDPITIERRREFPTSEPDDGVWSEGLTTMRRTMQGEIDARILLGGRVENYKGRMPGVAEEALLSLQSGQPVFLLGGFGGCTRDIAGALGFADNLAGSRLRWQGLPEFEDYGPVSLNNGLSVEENQVLAQTPYVDRWLPLLLHGLRRLFG